MTSPTNPKDINAHDTCFALRKASRAVTQLYDRALEPAGIRSTQFTLLVTMASVSARTLTEMANVLVMDRTTLTRNLKPLEKLNFIQTVEARDRRSKAYALTEAGRDALARGIPLWENAQEKVHTSLGSERVNHLQRELDIATRALTEI